jgi:hypothetical protein
VRKFTNEAGILRMTSDEFLRSTVADLTDVNEFAGVSGGI